MILLFIFLLFAFEASYEGIYDRGLKTLSGVIEFVYRTTIMTMILLWIYEIPISILNNVSVPLWQFILGTLLFRYMFFDQIYNLFKKHKLFYIGTIKIYDKIFRKFLKITNFPSISFQVWTKIIFGSSGIALMGYPLISAGILIGFVTLSALSLIFK